MQHQPIDKTAASIAPLHDTWGWKKYAGTWGITPPFNFTTLSTQEVNIWFAKTLISTLEAFFDLARVWQVSFGTDYTRADLAEPITLEWKLGESYENYIEDMLREIQQYAAPISTIEIKVDLYVYVRTPESPNQPIRVWVRELGEFEIRGGPEYGEPYLHFDIAHTLFYPYTMGGENNSELYFLNQPLLENALRCWEKSFGPICEVEGLLAGIYEYGFKPEEEGDATSTN